MAVIVGQVPQAHGRSKIEWCQERRVGVCPRRIGEKTEYLSEILGRNLVLDGQYVPIEIGKFKDAIALQIDAGDDI